MSKQIKLKVITPEKLILEENVDEVLVPTTEGEIGILPMHIPLVAGLKSGDVVGVLKDERIPVAVVGGFVEVKKDEEGNTVVIVLADFAEHVGGLTDEVIEQAKARAEELKSIMENKDNIDFEHFATELERSLTRIKIADKWRTKKYRK
jgi:F-type H+-transporting ATPase subunit epsilon